LQSQRGNEATLTPVCRSFLNRQKTRTGHPSTMIHPYNRARKRCAPLLLDGAHQLCCCCCCCF
jgi:hypothetical protein